MKGEVIGILDGKTILSMEMDNEAENPVTLHLGPGFKDAVKKMEFYQIEALMEIVKSAYSAVSKSLQRPVFTTRIKAPKLLAIGEAATEMGDYRVIDPMAKKVYEAGNLFQDIAQRGNADTIDAMLEAMRGIKLPEPPAVVEEPTEPTGDVPSEPQ